MAKSLEEQIQQAVKSALTAKEEEIEARLRSQMEREQEKLKMSVVGTALNEGSQLYLDPGTGYEFALVSLDKIDFNPLSRRTEEELSPDAPGIKQLIEDIKKKGGLNRPLLVYRKNNRYMLVKGAKRLAALRAMGEELNHAYILPAKPPIDMEERWVNGY